MQATALMARENAISDKYSHCGGGEGSVCSERGVYNKKAKGTGCMCTRNNCYGCWRYSILSGITVLKLMSDKR